MPEYFDISMEVLENISKVLDDLEIILGLASDHCWSLQTAWLQTSVLWPTMAGILSRQNHYNHQV